MTIKPLFDKVVVKSIEAEEKTASGILLPGTAQEKPQMAEVVAVGPGGLIDGIVESENQSSQESSEDTDLGCCSQ